ncbi:hypothetical protein LF1_03530 [Rubripirellula obstinata]|uniref:Squalene cyclase C-terminal domain-containing protein n=1 Tax=Rubripirellula obstinata TaxID=406547 RepID=A0A5B1CEH3_9BACT|nr:hypothetical protein [Rubripirellula obstinata]KAA1257863.1 hypothetical protein LF1_03530 [Rubripirellula obstinata]
MKAPKIGTTSTTATNPVISLPPKQVSEKAARWSGTENLPELVEESGSQATPDDLKTSQRPSGFPAFLVSTIFHTALLILLALLGMPSQSERGLLLTARRGEAANVLSLQQIDLETQDLNESSDDAATDVVSIEIAPRVVESASLKPSPVVTDTSVVPIDDALAALSGGSGESTSLIQIATGGGLAGRSPEKRKQLAMANGGSIASENAVDMALDYLSRHQRRDGSWSFDLKLDPCGGKCRNNKKAGEDPTPPTAATGLAVLAFLGAGHTHTGNGPYADQVRRGLYYLRSVAKESEQGLDWQTGSMYGHGIAMMAVGEAMAMTTDGDPKNHEFYDLMYGATSFTCNAQHRSGSWGYYPQSPGDLTLTGWQVLSLIGARRNHIRLHTNTLADAKEFTLSTREDDRFWFGYKGPPGEPTTTAVGLTLMLYLGEPPGRSRMMEALSELAQRGPTLTNIYHDYYGTLALHHSRHSFQGKHDWEKWNGVLRDHLVQTQEKTGHEKGSWHFDDRWGNVGGRIYTTAMCALTLQAYYRYEPLYGPANSFQLD